VASVDRRRLECGISRLLLWIVAEHSYSCLCHASPLQVKSVCATQRRVEAVWSRAEACGSAFTSRKRKQSISGRSGREQPSHRLRVHALVAIGITVPVRLAAPLTDVLLARVDLALAGRICVDAARQGSAARVSLVVCVSRVRGWLLMLFLANLSSQAQVRPTPGPCPDEGPRGFCYIVHCCCTPGKWTGR
jgi:hypothetical protein